MGDLIAFVTARLDEDEAAAKKAMEFGDGVWALAPHFHTARHDPARVLREVAAKRARLAYYQDAQSKLDHIVAHPGEMPSGDEGTWLGKTAAARTACRYDAAIWDDHPDYRPEWKP